MFDNLDSYEDPNTKGFSFEELYMFGSLDSYEDPNMKHFSFEEERELDLPSSYVALKQNKKALGLECPEKTVRLRKGVVGVLDDIFLDTQTNNLFCWVNFEYQIEPFCTASENYEIILARGFYNFEDLIFLNYDYKLIEKK